MKLLWLGNSDDLVGDLPDAQRAGPLVAERFRQELGEDVELTVKAIWPTADLPDLVDRWMERYEPDLVLVRNTHYWSAYPSLAVRVRRVLGPLGAPLSAAGDRAANARWLGRTKPFYLFRRLALHTIGGDPTFNVDDLIERMSDVTRVVLRHEDVVTVVLGPEGNNDYSYSRRNAREIELRRSRWHQAMKQLCSDLSVEYLGWDKTVYEDQAQDVVGDGVHITAAEHQFRADFTFEFLLRAWTNAGRRAVLAPAVCVS